MSDQIIVIGHKSPDTDTVVSAIACAKFLNAKCDKECYIPKITATPNSETQFVLDKFNVETPDVFDKATGEELFLVDHNESTQVVDGEKKIVGIIDHHKVNVNFAEPIDIITKPWGCTATILYDLLKKNAIEIEDSLKAIMLCAILSDTVILKSPTTTQKDVEVVEELSKELSLDYKELGMEMFKAKAQVSSKTPMEIIKNDFKDFEFDGKKVGVGQIETPDLEELHTKVPEIITEVKKLRDDENYDAIILMMTDIIREGTRLLIVSSDDKRIADMFDIDIQNNVTSFIDGMMSRKKQVAPVLSEKY